MVLDFTKEHYNEKNIKNLELNLDEENTVNCALFDSFQKDKETIINLVKGLETNEEMFQQDKRVIVDSLEFMLRKIKMRDKLIHA